MQDATKTERVHKFLSEDLTIRIASVIATGAVEDMRAVHNSAPIPTVAVGKTMIGALLMAAHLKDGQELSLYFRGSGPLQSLFAEASFEGKVRAYCGAPQLEGEIPENGILTGDAIGIGLLTVTNNMAIHTSPHRGTVEIRTGEIGDDIAYYLEQSHQIPSVVALGVHVNRYGRVEAAGGVLIELMPGHKEESVGQLEAYAKRAPSISKRIIEGASPEDLVRDFLQDIRLIELEHNYPIEFKCRCSLERVHRSVRLLGLEAIDDLISEAKSVDMACEFCGKKYIISLEDLGKIRQEVYKASLN